MVLATDLDGTLLHPKRPIRVLSGPNRDFLRSLIADGGRVILVSGRNFRMKAPIESVLGHPVTFVGCNGSYVMGESGEIEELYTLDQSLLLEIYSSCVGRYGISAWCLMDTSDMNWIDTRNLAKAMTALMVVGNAFTFRIRERHCIGTEKFLNRLAVGGVCKLMTFSGLGRENRKRAAEAYVAIRDRFGDRCSVALSSSVLEITPIQASKGMALSGICQREGIDPDSVLVVGDSGNDISMFDRFPHSFCMEGADPWVLERANHVVSSVSEIARYIENPALMKGDRRALDARLARLRELGGESGHPSFPAGKEPEV